MDFLPYTISKPFSEIMINGFPVWEVKAEAEVQVFLTYQPVKN